ncbi:hypothetical protein G6016_04660 [Dietzia aerolata]|uniref:Uncharacterized protein n=1 Tax=Dietzia aerolata TaxID=595984 RepID=A0ABV5JUH6_9ACTN|nr:hypothetical protein [Dietzia aerolata]MBB0968262.1 hypothetical protein [Dietzia aerolata]
MIVWIVSALLAIVGGLLLAVGGGLAEFSGVYTLDDEPTAVLAITGIVVVILNAVVIALALRMRRGGRAARVILTVVGIASLVSLWVGASQGTVPLLHTLVTGAAVLLMWFPDKEQQLPTTE